MSRNRRMNRRAPSYRAFPQVEELERRLAPATLVNASTLTYQDVDGANVPVALSKPLLTSVSVANNVFGFNTGSVSGSNGVKQQLQTLDFTKLPIPSLASGVSVTVTAARSPTNGGDGLANVGFINATGINLGGI